MTAMTLDQAVKHVTTTNPMFEVTTANVRGVDFRVFKNIPPTVGALVQASIPAQGNGDLEYIVFEDERWTFGEFCNDVKAMADALQDQLGVKSGDRVAVAMRNYPEMCVLVLAITTVGAVVVFVNAWWTTEELDYAMRDSEPSIVFADGPRLERLKPLRDTLGLTLVGVRDGEGAADNKYSDLKARGDASEWPTVTVDTDDDFAIMYSSGTTGHPKGVVQTHRGAVNSIFTFLLQAVIAPLIDPPDPDAPEAARLAALVATPLFHVTASHTVFLLSMPAGAKLVLIPKWDPAEAMRLIEQEHITRFVGVPTQSADIMELARSTGSTLDSLNFIGSGGAKRPPAQVAQLVDTFPNAAPATGWGMTETNAIGMGLIGKDYVDRPHVAGRLYPPLMDMKLLDENRQEVPQGEVGEIVVKGPSNMRCYLNKPEATDEVLSDGWLSTGDLAYLDDEGFVTIVDRKKNIIIRGGENIACLDVEAAIHRHSDVIEACAFSVPNKRLGEVVGVGVHLRDGSDLDAAGLRNFLADHIAHFKIPDHIWFQNTPIPRAATDKADRRALRDTLLQTLNKENA